MRRRRQEEHENHERWLVSYADFITLLFAFFVVMYSISSLNEGKYKILSETLTGIFNEPSRSTKPIPVGDQVPRSATPAIEQNNPATGTSSDPSGENALEQIADSMQAAFGDLIGSDQMTIRGTETWLEVELNSNLLFPSGDAIPSDSAFNLIAKVAKILAPYRNPVQVEGFTDNLPIHTAQYPTNWELSAARSASIVRLLIGDGVAPERLAVVGYGSYQPVASNATPEGRARNRRVVLLISRHVDIRRGSSGFQNTSSVESGTQRAPASVK
ncbi:chemotaxis protein MotB [Pseudomonas duriflava]|uniref:Chemotaxis protein MotB n=1 Tax=Pseudomonas duriflava TaxID=459528 RepID=A0A562QAX7_9PSED|nr:flagellar motor protein MotD [Pseudomonas duriflava]TWI53898.1 chemotaxis protein MotB [Pseudomonas duriflava]